MSYPKKLLRLQPNRGFIADTPGHEASEKFWTICQNVIFRDGFATRLGGFREAYATEIANIVPDEFFHALDMSSAAFSWWLMLQNTGTVHAMQAGVETQIDNGLFTPVARPQEYTSSLLNGLPVISNGRDEPVYWPGSGTLLTLPGWTATESCKFISVLKYHIFAMNITGPGGTFENLVKWSASTEPGSVPNIWTPGEDNDSGSVELSDSPGPILCAYPLADSLYFFKRSATYNARFVGGQNVFTFRKIQASSGALTSRSVCDVGAAHLVVADGDITLNDGTTRKSIGESRVKDWLFNQLDSVEYEQLFCTYNRAKDEVIIGFPSSGSQYCDSALVYDLGRDSFGVRQIQQATHAPVGLVRDTVPANTWANRTETWEESVGTWASSLEVAATDSLLFLHAKDFIQQDVTTESPIDCIIGRDGLTFGEPERVKFVKRVHIRTKEPYTELFVRIGGSMQPNGAVTWSPEVRVTGTQQIINMFASGRYIAVTVRSIDGHPWSLTGLDLEAEIRGYH